MSGARVTSRTRCSHFDASKHYVGGVSAWPMYMVCAPIVSRSSGVEERSSRGEKYVTTKKWPELGEMRVYNFEWGANEGD